MSDETAGNTQTASNTQVAMGAPIQRQATGVVYVLWLLLGGFGVHRFYLGRAGSGFVMLLLGGTVSFFGLLGFFTLGVTWIISFVLLIPLGIWWLVDLFLIPEMMNPRGTVNPVAAPVQINIHQGTSDEKKDDA